MLDPFAHMAATLRGTAPPALLSKAETTAARLARAVEVLRQDGDPDAQAVAEVLETWLQRGGDLGAMLGAKVARGKRNELPHNRLRRGTLAAVLVSIVADEHGRVPDPRHAANDLSDALRRHPAVVDMIREQTGVARVPTSVKALLTLLHGAE